MANLIIQLARNIGRKNGGMRKLCVGNT